MQISQQFSQTSLAKYNCALSPFTTLTLHQDFRVRAVTTRDNIPPLFQQTFSPVGKRYMTLPPHIVWPTFCVGQTFWGGGRSWGAQPGKKIYSLIKKQKNPHTHAPNQSRKIIHSNLSYFHTSNIQQTIFNLSFFSLSHTHTPITCYNFKSYTIIIYISNSHSIAITLALT